jgi:hypothetical protein
MPKPPKREYRALPRDLPDREPFASLPSNAKLLLIMLRLTLGPAGIALVPPKRFAATFGEQTGLGAADLKRAVRELCGAKELEIEGSIVWNIEQLADDPLLSDENPKHRVRITRELAKVPSQPIVARFRQKYADWFRPDDALDAE